MKLRVGLGFDSHALIEGRSCVLGGVRIPHPTGPVGHSDGDAVLHAIADALLGAAGLDDLGTLFPDTDARWRGADSGKLLEEIASRVRAAGWKPVNVDVVVVTNGPRVAAHREAMRRRIGELVGLDAADVNVKGKSPEGLPAADGAGAVVAYAVCLVSR